MGFTPSDLPYFLHQREMGFTPRQTHLIESVPQITNELPSRQLLQGSLTQRNYKQNEFNGTFPVCPSVILLKTTQGFTITAKSFQ